MSVTAPRFADVEIGHELPRLDLPPILRSTLAYFAGSSGDRNPIHLDIDFAREAGLSDVFAHGMLVMAYAGRQLTDWAGPFALLELDARFVSITQLYEQLHCSARVTAKSPDADGGRVDIALEVRNAAEELKLSGRAVVRLS